MQTIRRIILAIVAVLTITAIDAQVPDNYSFSLQDVVNEVNPSSSDLYECFEDSDPSKFDDAYTPSGFDPHLTDKSGYELKYFRNYNGDTGGSVLTASPSTLDFASGGTPSQTSDITSSSPWTVNSYDSWINVTKYAGYVDVSCDKNTGSSRTGSISLSNNDGEFETITVNQDAG